MGFVSLFHLVLMFQKDAEHDSRNMHQRKGIENWAFWEP